MCAGDLGASSGGAVNLGDVSGAVLARTTRGSVHLDSAKGRVKVTTGGGSIELYPNLSQGRRRKREQAGLQQSLWANAAASRIHRCTRQPVT